MSRTRERKIKAPLYKPDWFISDAHDSMYYVSHKSNKALGREVHVYVLADHLEASGIKEVQVVLDPGEDHKELYKVLRKYKGRVWY